jgi:hypothetical protein
VIDTYEDTLGCRAIERAKMETLELRAERCECQRTDHAFAVIDGRREPQLMTEGFGVS